MSVEDQYAETVAIVYPAVAPSDNYLLPVDKEMRSHVTVCILGEIPELNLNKEELITKLRSIAWEDIQEADVTQLDLFGVQGDFLVMLLQSTILQNNWKRVNEALEEIGILRSDKYPDYRPHLTLKEKYEGSLPSPEILPKTVTLSAPTLWWGTETIRLS